MTTLAPPPRMSAPPRNAAPVTPAADRPKLGKIDPSKDGKRIVVNAVEGWGKTSLIAYADNPAIIMTKGETGYATLLNAGRVPNVDAVNVESWPDLLGVVDDLNASTATVYGTLGLDALGGAERLCHEFVCKRDYKGDWGEKGFGSYQRGYDLSVSEWEILLAKLDRLRAKGTNIVILGHSRIKTFKNPQGPDYDKFVADCHDKTWAPTHRWADAALFGQFVTVIDKEVRGKGKGIGGSDRVVYTQHRDAYDAKNRFGMPESIDIPEDPTQIYSTIWSYITNGKEAE